MSISAIAIVQRECSGNYGDRHTATRAGSTAIIQSAASPSYHLLKLLAAHALVADAAVDAEVEIEPTTTSTTTTTTTTTATTTTAVGSRGSKQASRQAGRQAGE